MASNPLFLRKCIKETIKIQKAGRKTGEFYKTIKKSAKNWKNMSRKIAKIEKLMWETFKFYKMSVKVMKVDIFDKNN